MLCRGGDRHCRVAAGPAKTLPGIKNNAIERSKGGTVFGEGTLTLLTHRLAGRSWLRQRLAAASGNLVDQGRGGLAVADYADADRCDAATSVLVVRNPLSMLLEASVEFRSELAAGRHPDAAAAELIALWRSFTTGGTAGVELRLPDFASLAADEPPLVVRIEDFVAFPAATLRRIGEYIDRPPSRDLLHAFLRADRPTRHHAQPAILPATRIFDLFSWVDEIPSVVAAEVYNGSRRFLDNYYPEVAAMLCEVDSPVQRQAA